MFAIHILRPTIEILNNLLEIPTSSLNLNERITIDMIYEIKKVSKIF